jgi:hypothetical protein
MHSTGLFIVIADESDSDLNLSSGSTIVRQGTFDNGSGYILGWYIVAGEHVDPHPCIIAQTHLEDDCRFIVWRNDGEEATAWRFANNIEMWQSLLEDEDNPFWIVIDTYHAFTDNPYRITN